MTYSHNDPEYINPLSRRVRQLQFAVVTAGDFREGYLGYRLFEMQKQIRELERHAHNLGFKRGAIYPRW